MKLFRRIHMNVLMLTISLVGIHATGRSQQKDPPAVKQAIALYKEDKYDEALKLFEKTISGIISTGRDDSLAMANCYNYAGLCYSGKKNYNLALTDFNASLAIYNALHSVEDVSTVLRNITATYKNSRQYRIPIINLQFDTTTTEQVYFSLQEVNSLTDDSAIVTLGEGKQDGLYVGASGDMISSYAVKVKDREPNEFLGTVKIISVSDFSATAIVRFYKKWKGVTIYPKDLLSLKAYPVAGVQKNIFYELAKLNILFIDNSREEIASRKAILSNKDPLLESNLMEVYARQISDFYENIKTYAGDSTFSTPYKKGRFIGNTLIESFGITSSYDLNSFFNFVQSFPAKYMGTNDWKINETYATWVLNEAIQGEKNRVWLMPAIEQTDIEDLSAFIKKTGYYISVDSLFEWDYRVNELLAANATDAAELLCNKLVYIARQLKDKHAEHQFYYTRSYIYDAQSRKKQSIDDAARAWKYDNTNINYMYQLASLYGKNDNFDSSTIMYNRLLKLMPGNTNIKGNFGWYKILVGKFDEATPLCRDAYYGDSSNFAFAVNYGHTFLLKGNVDSAKYYYTRTLKNLSTPSDYYEGPKKDFETFFNKGWQRKNIAAIMDWMENEFTQKYYAITQGNVVWAAAKKQYDAKKYVPAAETWISYTALFDTMKDPPYDFIQNGYNWAGYCFALASLNDSAIKYYNKAIGVSAQHLVTTRNAQTTVDNDYMVGNYKRVYNFYNDIGNDNKALEYKSMYEAEIQKVTELNTSPLLHFICIGGNDKTGNGAWQAGAKLFSDNLKKLTISSDSSYQLLSDNKLTKEKLLAALEQARKKSKPEDIFIFYYAGNSSNDKGQPAIVFNSKDSINGKIPLDELLNSIDLIYAQKKMIITDEPNQALFSLIADKYASRGNSSAEMIFVCPGVKTPVQENNCSVFTNELVTTLNNLQKQNKFSAKDFVDKASYAIGRGQYYMPVLSFTYGKDFLLFDNKANTVASTTEEAAATRGAIVANAADNPDPAVSGTQKNYALLFASDDYMEFNKLNNPVRDATSVSDILKTEFNFITEVISNPTLDEILNKLNEYREKKYGPNDQLFIFFAGHGVYYEKAKMGYLIAKDSKLADPNQRSYLSYSDLGTLFLKNIECNRIFLALDACFAGSFFDQNSARGGEDEAAKANLDRLKRTGYNKRYYKGISSGGKQYVEDGKKGQHSPFAQLFIKTLLKERGKNFITADEIIAEIKNNPPSATAICEGNFNYSDPESHFIFEYVATEKVSTIKVDNMKRN